MPKNLNSYSIAEADRLGEGAASKQKITQRNLTAIQTLRALEAEARPATTEKEKAALWSNMSAGARLPQVFDVDNAPTGAKRTNPAFGICTDRRGTSFPPEPPPWATLITLRRRSSVRCIAPLCPASASRAGGSSFEPACGIGHFIGLMPEAMLHRSTVSGIEIDPLTARIAKAVYPDADIRSAQPFEQSKLCRWILRSRHFQCSIWRLHRSRSSAWNSISYKFSIHDYFFAAALEKVRPGGLPHVPSRRLLKSTMATSWTRPCANCCPPARSCSGRNSSAQRRL